ncbi:MAG: TolC family protein [Gammaproteobacteria bacterium]|jgi:outer membrane protein TolC|nr:TolC family protein [Gammaproteobacteria bacterium]MBT3859803.1 TolC family protein [Gammaproteobacteria bacterium]MBT3988867.1 TolC family protein [Gammaproteobacteria bacterium]MBT4254912.1 TolC family protein [Gammaproteobacteria bacterium]MBT4580901.1 TolC family protein [Gammaproteobacteria bacterium]
MKYTIKSTACALFSLLLAACSSNSYKESADNESYQAIAGKSELVPGMSQQVLVDEEKVVDLDAFAINEDSYEFLDEEADSEIGAHILNLNIALDLAFQHSKDYQTQKERLYLEALALTFDRYRYSPTFSASAGGDYLWDTEDQFVTDMQALTGMENISTSESVDAGTSLGARYLLKGGGAIALNLTSNFTRFLTGDISEFGTTALIGSFTQPLLRDFGTEIEAENLMQAERDLLYQLRDFTRFRKTFAVRVASNYYSVLLNRETAINNYAGLQANNLSLEREQAFQAEGLTTLLEVGRLEQSALQADLRWTSSITRYKRSLDNFKILIGLDADDSIVLDDNEMTLITESGMESPDISLEQATEMAVQTRLDLYSELDRVQDAARKIEVAANALNPTLDFNLVASIPDSNSGNLGELDFENAVYRAGLDIDLPLDSKQERNNYRRTLIDYDASTRDYLLALDEVKLDVLDTWRRMNEASKSYDINVTSVEINERRVEEAELRAELGLGDIQDTVDSQNDLTAARTELVSSIVEQNIAKLEFWRDVGLLYVNDNGQWEEGINEPR